MFGEHGIGWFYKVRGAFFKFHFKDPFNVPLMIQFSLLNKRYEVSGKGIFFLSLAHLETIK